MSQSGYTPIQLYRTTTAAATPTAGNLAAGELAINLTDEKLYFKNAGGTVKLLASTDTLGTVTSVAASGGTTGLTFSGSPITTSGTLTLGGTLTVANGGTGATSLTSGYLVKGNGTSAVSASVVYDDGTNVGIGTSSPSVRFQIDQNQAAYSYFDYYNTTNAGGIVWRQIVRNIANTGTTSVDFAKLISSGFAINNNDTNAANFTSFGVGGSERMRIDSSGNVGIGTSSPSNLLEVRGAVTTTFSPNVYNTTLTGTASATSGNAGNGISFRGYTTGTSTISDLAFVSGIKENTTDGNYAGALVFGTRPNGSGGGSMERMRIDSTGGITSSDLADAVGYKGLPQNSQTSSYTLALSDMGKHISITTGGVVIPANASVAFPIGATIVVFNNSGSTQTISITSDTLRQAGTTNTGSRTLAVYGLATLVKVTSTVWAITGNVT